MTVIISSEKPKFSRYSAYSGVGSVVPSIVAANAYAAAAKPARRPTSPPRRVSLTRATGEWKQQRCRGASALYDADRAQLDDRLGEPRAADDVDDDLDVLVGEWRLLGE